MFPLFIIDFQLFIFFVFQLNEDWNIDAPSYTFRKLDPDSPDTRKMVNEYLLHEGEFEGRKFNQGKIFKWCLKNR